MALDLPTVLYERTEYMTALKNRLPTLFKKKNTSDKQSAEQSGKKSDDNKKTGIKIAITSSVVAIIVIGLLVYAYVATRMVSTQKIASDVCPSIVGIVQYKRGTLSETGEGSGIIISKNGYIVTNNHVVEGADRLLVVTNCKDTYNAKIIGTDVRTDIAVIKVEADNLTPAKFGDSDKCCVGDQVVAIGNPSGITLAGSVTQGIISAIDRDIDVGNGPMSLIQTDAAINPGNSGGALINRHGEVIGINSAKIAQAGYEGIGFSIPISFAKPIIKNIIDNGYVKGRVRFGMKCCMIDNATAESENLPAGIYVQYVDPQSEAAKAGIRQDDIITAINGININSTSTLISERDRHKPGEKVKLAVYRRSAYSSLIVEVKLMEDKGAAESWKMAPW